MSEKETCTIRIYDADRKRIASYGFFGESFADVVTRILDEYEENKIRESKKVNPCEATLALASA